VGIATRRPIPDDLWSRSVDIVSLTLVAVILAVPGLVALWTARR
jgi:hypothetical protein